jgi:hypothetical protein
MGGIRNSPTYIYQHPSGYIFRYTLSKDVRS